VQDKWALEEYPSTRENNQLWDDSGEATRNGKQYMDYVESHLLDVDERIKIMDATGRAGAAHPAARQRLPAPGPGQIPRVVRRRPARRAGRVHGRLAGPVGHGRARRDGRPARLAHQAELVPGHHRGPDDPPPAQRAMSQRAGSKVTEVAASHSVFLSQPAAVAALIEQAAAG
jgi:hypothetical protein